MNSTTHLTGAWSESVAFVGNGLISIIGDTNNVTAASIRRAVDILGWDIDWEDATMTIRFAGGNDVRLAFDDDDEWNGGMPILDVEIALQRAVKENQ